jgi:uncharacterized HhH-GPD family protein
MDLHITGDAEADALISRDPFSLLTAMLLDQQVPMEKAFSGPAVIVARMGTPTLDARAVADADPEEFVAVMTGPPAVHRYPRSMAGRVQSLARAVVEGYQGDAARIWADVDDAAELLRRLKALPGFGPQKAKIFVALLAKRRGVAPAGWERAAGDYGLPGHRSVADVVDDASLLKVRETKRAAKAEARAART